MQPSQPNKHQADVLDPSIFRAPGPRFQGVALWFLNDLLDTEPLIKE